MRCLKCNSENRDGAKFCIDCGAPLAGICPQCGFANPADAKFCSECGAAFALARQRPLAQPRRSKPHPASDEPAERADAPDGERKTVTALFADIKGSTELLEGLDPEEARHIIDPALALMSDSVRHYDGYVAQSTGDGIFALFGAPIAREDHANRALYAALRMQEELRRYAGKLREEGNPPIAIRIGVSTGEVVVRSIQTGQHPEYLPIGHSINLASRMQTLAAPGSIVVSDETHCLTEGYFLFRALGPARLKGVSGPIDVFEVAGLGPLRTRLELSAQRGLSRFVGRQAELDTMRLALDEVRAGRGRIVAVAGEAGVGKSRLFFEFKAIARAGCLVLEAFSESTGKSTPLLPLAELMRDYFGITPDDDDRRRNELITGKVLALDRALEDALPYLFHLLDVAAPATRSSAAAAASGVPETLADHEALLDRLGAHLVQQMDAGIRRDRTFDAVTRILSTESHRQPLILVFEDLHWIDPDSEAFLAALSGDIANAPILLLVNYRPEYRLTLAAATLTELRLEPLARDSAEAMLDALLGTPDRDGDLATLRRFIVEKTEGNPFFMEELVQALIDQGAVARNGAVRVLRPPSELRIPATVQGILASRIDRLPPDAKDLLQTLAVIGKEFSFALIRKLADRPDAGLNRALGVLESGEFVFEQPAIPEPDYVFKHALTREVAYNTMLLERRRQLHERVARAIEATFADKLDERYPELANHFRQAGLNAEAIQYLQMAGLRELRRSDHQEAAKLLTDAIAIVDSEPRRDRDDPQRDQQEYWLSTLQGLAFMAVKGFPASETEQAFLRAERMALKAGYLHGEAGALLGLFGCYFTRGEVALARQSAERLMILAQQTNSPAIQRDAHREMGEVMEFSGELAGARHHLEQGLAITVAAPLMDIEGISFGPDPKVLCLNGLCATLWGLGYPDQALARADEAVELMKDGSDPFSLAMAIFSQLLVRFLRRDIVAAEERVDSLERLAIRFGFPYWRSEARRFRGSIAVQRGQLERGVELLCEDLADTVAQSSSPAQAHAMMMLAGGLRALGRLDEALALADRALEVFRERGGIHFDEHRVRGELLSALGREEEGEQVLRDAIALCASHFAKSPELRATTSLAMLLANRGQRDEARAILAPVYSWFTEGFDTADLKDAKALLDQLAP